MSVDIDKLKAAIKKRKHHVLDNLDTLTMKQFRALLEDDMKLPEKSLRVHKEDIEEMVDQLVTSHKKGEVEKEKQARVKAKGKAEAGPVKKVKAQARPNKPQKGRDTKKPKPKDPEVAKPAAGAKQHSKAVEKMKKVCKQAGIKIPPNIYRGKTGSALEEAFDNLLGKHDLAQHSSASDIAAAAKKLQKERDLEGIDTSNIVEGGRRSRGRVDYSAVLKPQGDNDTDSDEEENEGNDSEESCSSDSEPDSNTENVSPASRPGRAEKRKLEAQKSSDAASEGDEADSSGKSAEENEDGSNEGDESDSAPVKTEGNTGQANQESLDAGRRKKVRVKAEPESESQTKGATPSAGKEKPRQPLQERNSGSLIKAEPSSAQKSMDQSVQPKRTLAAWSDDDD